MGVKTLHFDNPRSVHHLCAQDAANLRLAADALDVHLTSRDAWIRIEGDDDGAVERAVRFFGELDRAREQGATIRKHEFLVALEAIRGGEDEALRRLFDTRIEVSPRRRPVAPKTFGQVRYIEAIDAHDLVLGIGPAGTGKTYLAMAMGVRALRAEKAARIILTRPAVEAGESLGFLPGDMHEKVLPYLRPLYDALYDMMDVEEIQRNMDRGVIEVVPLAYMRGRTLNNAFVILDEAQNSTSEQMLMFLTRLGFDSKCVVTGDVTQVDLPSHRQSGLVEAEEVLRGIRGIRIVRFDESDVVRHELVQKIIQAYRASREAEARVRKPGSAPTTVTSP
jgi:phosphate starvation-inducible PhoH-like protein